jgi:hypothetical protein
MTTPLIGSGAKAREKSKMADSEFTNVRGTVKFYNEAKG